MTERKRIYPLRTRGISPEEMVDLAKLLIKAGYSVRIVKCKGKSGATYNAVEYWEEEE